MGTTQNSLSAHRLKPDPYLDEFERINEQVYFYAPSKSDAEGDSSDPANQPDLLFICSWMYASSRNVKKYIAGYKEMFPNTPILLHKQQGADIFWNSFATQRKNVQPVLKLVRSLVENKSPAKLRVLTHVFSNGGSYTANFLTDNYLKATAELFPISALILDSTPSYPNLSLAYAAVSEELFESSDPEPFGHISRSMRLFELHSGKRISTTRSGENSTIQRGHIHKALSNGFISTPKAIDWFLLPMSKHMRKTQSRPLEKNGCRPKISGTAAMLAI